MTTSKLKDLPKYPAQALDLLGFGGDPLYLHFHQSISPLSEGNHLHLDLVDSFVEFFLVLPLLSPPKHLLLWWDLRVKDLTTSSVLAIA